MPAIPNAMLPRRDLDPVAADHLGVGHESDLEVDVGLEGFVGHVVVGQANHRDLVAVKQSLGGSDQARDGQGDLDKGPLLVALKCQEKKIWKN